MLTFRHVPHPDTDVHVADVSGYRLVVRRDRGRRKWTARLLDEDKNVIITTKFFAPTSVRAAEAAVNLIGADLRAKAAAAAEVLPELAPGNARVLSSREKRAAFVETRDALLREHAGAAIDRVVRDHRLRLDLAGENFRDACVAGVVDHVTANLTWDESLTSQLARAIDAVFWPSLLHKYWAAIDAAPGDKPDVPPPERRAATDLADLRRLANKYAPPSRRVAPS